MKRPAIVFDLVGTLLQTALPVGVVYSKLLTEYGIRSDPKVMHDNFIKVFDLFKFRPQGTIPKDGNDKMFWEKIVKTVLQESGIPLGSFFSDYFNKLYAYYSKKEAWKLYPEVVSALEKLTSLGFPLFVASNWDSRARTVLMEWGIMPFFSDIFLSAECGVAKPEALFYHLILLKTRQVSSTVFFVEDDPQMLPPYSEKIRFFLLKRPITNLFDLLSQLQKSSSDQ
ncbi:haloacid dehalogenase [Methylacidiphilum kamchatkense Kam1]|uniref:Haloacid dehalogenase n=2 Tax=Methylacidiphilum kamchatkense Kam1 TaxID=1202785 RepID=A0ABR4ZZE8_9BACT|nr:HAD family hydrolase [Methylacidiphilum kamchatkense]KIE59078.1 haloacid dehalogenase [Methylacidiphilum kamchatkense Kam1]